jgi:hypothetical protein
MGLHLKGSWFSTGASFFEAELVLILLSSLAIISPNADLPDQIDPPLNFHAARIGALWVDTPCGAGGSNRPARTILLRLYPFSLRYGAKTKINILHKLRQLAAAIRLVAHHELAVSLDER